MSQGKFRFSSRLFGQRQEKHAASYLRNHGLMLIERNFSCRFGEIDLVMRDRDGTLVFVEVRYRSRLEYGDAIASVTGFKQHRIRNAAAVYLQVNPCWQTCNCRFDVIGISPVTTGHTVEIDWIRNAFQ